MAVTGLFNFIRDNRTEADLDEQEWTEDSGQRLESTPFSGQAAVAWEGINEELEKLWDEIASAMWTNYVPR